MRSIILTVKTVGFHTRVAYKGTDLTPVFRTAEGVFTVSLMNRNVKTVENESANKKTAKSDSKEKTEIMSFAKQHEFFSRKDIDMTFGFGTTKSFRILKELCHEGRIEQERKQDVYRMR